MNIIKNAVPIGLIIAVASISSPIGAQSVDTPARGPIPFAALDKNGNGFVSENEFNTVRGQRMAARAAEGRPMRGVASAPSFSSFDTNSDGQLTQSELISGQKVQMEKRRGMGSGYGPGMGPGQGRGMGMMGDNQDNMPMMGRGRGYGMPMMDNYRGDMPMMGRGRGYGLPMNRWNW